MEISELIIYDIISSFIATEINLQTLSFRDFFSVLVAQVNLVQPGQVHHCWEDVHKFHGSIHAPSPFLIRITDD